MQSIFAIHLWTQLSADLGIMSARCWLEKSSRDELTFDPFRIDVTVCERFDIQPRRRSRFGKIIKNSLSHRSFDDSEIVLSQMSRK